MKKISLIVLVLLVFATGCTENINLKIAGGSGTIVIEGSIENGKPAEVVVTRNTPISQSLDYKKILVTDALVYVSDGSNVETLLFGIDSSTSIPLAYKGNKIVGSVGGAYSLTVVADGNTYTATTTIPALVKLSSVWWKADPPHDSLGYAWMHLNEPAGLENAYRFYAKRPRKDRRYLPASGLEAPPTFDDKFIDGKSFDSFYSRGIDPTSTSSEDTQKGQSKYYYKITDTIYIKFCTIDYSTFRFYLSYETALQGNGNPFASPVSIKSNISNGGLGVWAGFGATFDTIYPKP